MIVKFLKSSASFKGVFYNMDKVSLNKAELMAVINFDALNGLDEVRPTDYVNQLKVLSALNKNISQPQLHVAISTEGLSHDKHQLMEIAVAWLEKMDYGKQPCLIFFHKDTDDNHVHIITTRVDHEGRKISSAFEHVRAVKAMNQIMGLDEDKTAQKDLEKALSYRFSTIAQFKLILEKQGYTIKDNDLIKFGKKLAELDFRKIEFCDPDMRRAAQLKAIVKKYAAMYDSQGLVNYMKQKMGVELVFHSKDGKPAYGYTVIDHAQKNVYKGGEIMPLKELTGDQAPIQQRTQYRQPTKQAVASSPDIPLQINIANDIDDQAVLGMKRRKKKTARTNQR